MSEISCPAQTPTALETSGPDAHEQSLSYKVINAIGVLLPTVAFVLTVIFSWGHWLSVSAVVVFCIMYLLTGFGVTVGLHRLITHRSFKTYRPLYVMWALLGALALEGPLINWVATHRAHHSFSDHDNDPHSPHGHGDGPIGAVKGLFYAHIGWLLAGKEAPDPSRYAPDLLRDKAMVKLNGSFLLLAVSSLVLIPGLLGLLIGGPGAIGSAVLAGGLLRVFWLHHVTYSINSLCHFVGRKKYSSRDESRNVFWLAPVSLGEAWHNNHHAFPASALHGLSTAERLSDPSGLLIRAMARLHLAWGVVSPSEQRRRQKLAVAH